jgi:hypothetical protein
LHLWLLRLHRCLRFPRSVQPPPWQAQATSHAGCRPARKQVSSELGPAITTPPRFRHRPYAFDTSTVVSLQSSSCLSPDLVLARPFPSALTTMAFDHSRRRWFGTCSCKPVPVGIELGRANGEVEGYHPRPFGCEVGSRFPPASRFPRPPYKVRFEVLAFSLLSLPHGHKVQALVRIRPVFLSLLIASPLALAAVVCSVLSSRARACRRDRQAPRVPLPDVGVTSIRETCPVSSEDITPRSWLLRTHSPIPSSSPLLWFVASFEESLQIATSLCCSRDLPSRGDPVSCRLPLAVSAVSSFVPA